MQRPADFFVTFWRDAKVAPASRVLTVDILLFTLAAMILMVIEARKHNVRFVWAYIGHTRSCSRLSPFWSRAYIWIDIG